MQKVHLQVLSHKHIVKENNHNSYIDRRKCGLYIKEHISRMKTMSTTEIAVKTS